MATNDETPRIDGRGAFVICLVAAEAAWFGLIAYLVVSYLA